MPRRFALALVGLLALLLLALFAGLELSRRRGREGAPPAPPPTPVVPPTPIPPKRITLYFESEEDEKLHPEARDVPASSDESAFLRSVASAVLEGPRKGGLLRPFPAGWSVRAAFRLRSGIVVLDLAPTSPSPTPTPAETPSGTPRPKPVGTAVAPVLGGDGRWNAGSHEELLAVQSLLVSVVTNTPTVERVILLVAGEPVDTLAGHVDLTHALQPDLTRVADEAPGEPPETATATPTAEAPAETPTETPPARPAATPSPTPSARSKTTPPPPVRATPRTPRPGPVST